MNTGFSDRVVTVTGGTGSFGSTMVEYLLQQGVREVRILSRDESKQDMMRHKVSDARVSFFIGDTRDEGSLNSVLAGSDLVFHAAALKQVPSAEFFPLEAVKTNVLGSSNVIRVAIDAGVPSVVCLSTDKAVYPINAMGMSKALMEKVALSFSRVTSRNETKVTVTRYGNVMYSRGSVIPLMISQIKEGKDVTVTDPEMTRFLMSLSDSVSLVEHAHLHGNAGDIFVRKAPATSIGTLAEALVEMFGSAKTRVAVIGFRHGEKLYESLLSAEEMAVAEDLGDYYRVPLDTRTLNYGLYFEDGGLPVSNSVAYTSHNTQRLNKAEVIELLQRLPEIQMELAK